MRWICLPSEGLGEDWYELSQKIDQRLSDWSMELSEESVFLLFDRAPGAILDGEGGVMIARPVIGPRKVPGPPFALQDWKAQKVYLSDLKEGTWTELIAECFSVWEEHMRAARSIENGFGIVLSRRLNPDLKNLAQVFFRQ
jgi:hypothetical protein